MNPVISFFNYYNEFKFECGKSIDKLTISYETYGELNEKKDNAILVCHFFSGNKHAAGLYDGEAVPGWWDKLIGPGKTIDTEKYFVICSDALCCMENNKNMKSSSPRDINPKTNKPYGMSFPVTTVKDMVRAQKLLIDHLGIKKLKAVMGPSMGGLQALQWSLEYPEMAEKIIPVAAADKLEGFSMFFPLRMGIESIKNDKHFNNGNYYDKTNKPMKGLFNAIHGLAIIARGRDWADAHLGGRAYLSNPYDEIDNLFSCEAAIMTGAIERGSNYDPNSYIYISKANILFDFFRDFKEEEEALEKLKADFLFIAEVNDIFITKDSIKSLYERVKSKRENSEYFEFSSPLGHLGSVTNSELFEDKVKEFLNK